MKPSPPDHSADAQAVEFLTIRLHELLRTEMGDTDDADELRETLLEPWNRLSQETRTLLDNLSGDLFMLSGTEHLSPGKPADVLAIRDAWVLRDWKRILELSRLDLPRIDASYRAYVRARAYAELGYHLAAFNFFDHASRLAGGKDRYEYLAIESLLEAGEIEDAWERAQVLLVAHDTSRSLLMKVADVMFKVAPRCNETFSRRLYERLISVVDRAVAGDPGKELLRSVHVGGLVKKGYALAHLQRHAEADRAFTAALDVDPTSDAVLVARGLLRLDQHQLEMARDDFEGAIRLGTPLAWPYMFAAKSALLSGEFARGLELAEKALLHPSSESIKANLLEFKGIALARLGFTIDGLIALRDADAQAHGNPRIVRNLTSAEGLGEPQPSSAANADAFEVAIDFPPHEAQEQLRLASGW